MRTYFSFGLILRDIPNSITPQTTLRLLPIPVGLLVLPCTSQCRRFPTPHYFPHFFFLLSPKEEPTKAGTCARDRRALQQLPLNVHVKLSDLTWPDLCLEFMAKRLHLPITEKAIFFFYRRATWFYKNKIQILNDNDKPIESDKMFSNQYEYAIYFILINNTLPRCSCAENSYQWLLLHS